MKTIWKFPLLIKDYQAVCMPFGAKILTVQTQYDAPCLWALVDTDNALENREIRIFGTGHSNVIGIYIGTFQIASGSLVFHVFEYVLGV